MLIVGLIIIAVGALLVLAGVFATELTSDGVELLGIALSPTALFLLGTAAGVAILWGLSVTKFGAKRELLQRKEKKRLDQLSEKLDRAEAGRNRDLDEDQG